MNNTNIFNNITIENPINKDRNLTFLNFNEKNYNTIEIKKLIKNNKDLNILKKIYNSFDFKGYINTNNFDFKPTKIEKGLNSLKLLRSKKQDIYDISLYTFITDENKIFVTNNYIMAIINNNSEFENLELLNKDKGYLYTSFEDYLQNAKHINAEDLNEIKNNFFEKIQKKHTYDTPNYKKLLNTHHDIKSKFYNIDYFIKHCYTIKKLNTIFNKTHEKEIFIKIQDKKNNTIIVNNNNLLKSLQILKANGTDFFNIEYSSHYTIKLNCLKNKNTIILVQDKNFPNKEKNNINIDNYTITIETI